MPARRFAQLRWQPEGIVYRAVQSNVRIRTPRVRRCWGGALRPRAVLQRFRWRAHLIRALAVAWHMPCSGVDPAAVATPRDRPDARATHERPRFDEPSIRARSISREDDHRSPRLGP